MLYYGYVSTKTLLYVFIVVETGVETSWHFLCFFPPLHLFFSYDGANWMVLNRGHVLFCGVTHLLIVCKLFIFWHNALKRVSVSNVLTCTGTPWQKQAMWPDLVELFSAILFHKNNTVWGQGDAGLERNSSLLFGCLLDDISSHSGNSGFPYYYLCLEGKSHWFYITTPPPFTLRVLCKWQINHTQPHVAESQHGHVEGITAVVRAEA